MARHQFDTIDQLNAVMEQLPPEARGMDSGIAAREIAGGKWELIVPDQWDNAVRNADPGALPVPVSVRNIQLRRALRVSGLKPAAKAFAETLDEDDIEEWEFADIIHRDHALIGMAAVALNKTEAEVDDLFRLAATL